MFDYVNRYIKITTIGTNFMSLLKPPEFSRKTQSDKIVLIIT